MARDPWHFRRDELAEQVLATLARGPVQALSLFAPRRAGKTEFLVQDLAPCAEGQGHRVIYASFWQAPLSPLAVLLHALEKSRELGGLADRIRTSALRVAPKLKLSASVPGTGAGAEAEIDLTRLRGEPPTNLLLHLDDLLGRVSTKGRPTILLLDEVQELARNRANASLVAALRTGLDKRRDGLRAVFTGSSRAGLAAMFSDREAPFFHFATPIDLPALRRGVRRSSRGRVPKNGETNVGSRRIAGRIQPPSSQSLFHSPAGSEDAVRPGAYCHIVSRGCPGTYRRGPRLPGCMVGPHPDSARSRAGSGDGSVAAVQPGLSCGAGCRSPRGCSEHRTCAGGASEAGTAWNCRRRAGRVGDCGSRVWRVDCGW